MYILQMTVVLMVLRKQSNNYFHKFILSMVMEVYFGIEECILLGKNLQKKL